jgi:MoaA/NifB/PqqE/SkfB family radical SAM enzyme
MFRALGDTDYGVGIAVSVTNSCPLTCKHCISNASPSGERPPEGFANDLSSLLDRNDFETRHVTLTGGEPFHDLKLLKELLAVAATRRIHVGAITSSFWAKTRERARAVLEQLPTLGELTLSVDAHHADFVPPAFVRNAFDAAREKGLKVQVRVCVQRPATAEDEALMAFVKEFCPTESLEIQQLIAYGRAAEHEEFLEQEFEAYEHCPAIGPHVYYNGEIIPCCNSIVPLRGDHPLRIGSVRDSASLKTLILENALFVTLKVWGSKRLSRLVFGEDAKEKNACDLCARVCTDAAAWEKVRNVVDSAEHRAETYAFALKHFGVAEAEVPLKKAITEIIAARGNSVQAEI